MFILDNVDEHPSDITRETAEKFSISRQAVNKHLKRLVNEQCLDMEGTTKSKVYKLHPLVEWSKSYKITDALAEDIVWREDIEPRMGEMPDNVNDIWHYAFTEILNNAIDHSLGATVSIKLSTTARDIQILLIDDGIGIFKKIQQELDLPYERDAVLELAKGKLTTDPTRHSGQGIFFTSRMLDDFFIFSDEVVFAHEYGKREDWIVDRLKPSSGTAVSMRLSNHTSRTMKTVFDQFTTDDDFGFTKTVVPVQLAQHGDEKLVSRSQAKRVITRFEKFKIVILDFEGVQSIGQGFSDEIFRVFAQRFPDIELIPTNANPEVAQMISRAHHHD